MSSWDRMGNRPIRFEEDVYWDRNGFGRYGESYYEEVYDQNQFGYFGCGEEQNGCSRNEEDDESLKDLMKTFIQVQNVKDEELELSLKMMDIQVDQSLRNYQARLRELEQKFEQMNEWVENQPTGQITSYIQSNPRLLINQYDPMRCSEPVSDSDEEEEEEIEMVKLPEDETMVKNEELDEKAEVSSNKDGTVETEDDEIGTLAGALENIVKQSQLEIIELHHTVNQLREKSILLKEHAEAQAKELLQRKDQVEELKEKERVSNKNVEGLTLGIVAAEEGITRLKVAAQQEAEARKAVEQYYISQLSTTRQELEEAKQVVTESERKLKFKRETAVAAMAAETSLELADTRGARLRKELDEEQKEKSLDVELEEFLGMSIEEASNRDSNDYGNITLEEIERIFDLSTEPSATKKKNPRLSNNQIDQGLRCQTTSHNAKNANAKDTRSGLNHGNGEEQNGNNKKIFAGPALLATQHTYGLRGNTTSVACFLSVAQSVASHLIPLRSNNPEQPGNDPKAHLEVGNHVGYEPMVYNEDETPNSTPIPPTKAYERRKEDSLDMELQEFLGMEMGKVDDTIVVDITLDEFERMFDISEDPDLVNEIVVEVEKELEPEMEIERESVIELDGEPCLPLKVDMNPISESKEVLQVTNVENDELLDFDYLLHGKPSMKGVEKDKYGGKVGKYNRGDGAIMRETKEWHNAMAKTRMMLIVSTYGIPCDDVIFGFVGERDVFGKWHGEGDWGKPLSHVSLLVEGRKSRAIDSCQKQALHGRQPGFANFIFFYFLLFVLIFSFIGTH